MLSQQFIFNLGNNKNIYISANLLE